MLKLFPFLTSNVEIVVEGELNSKIRFIELYLLKKFPYIKDFF